MKDLTRKAVAVIATGTFLFSGDSCSLLTPDPCLSVICQNGGTCLSDGTCSCHSLFTGDRCEMGKDQTWELIFQDGGSTPHLQYVKVSIKGFVNSGTFTETSDSAGLWMYDPAGNKCYKLSVGGNIVRDSPGDRWTFVNMGGSGCGMQTLALSSSGTANANFPIATGLTNGQLTLRTTSPLGTFTGQVLWYGIKK
jgi:hypothetical protein